MKIDSFLQGTIMAATFGLVLSLWMVVLMLWSMRRTTREDFIRKRFQFDEPTDQTRPLKLWHEGREAVIQRPILRRIPVLYKLETLFREAGWEVDVKAFATGSFVLLLLSLVFSYVAAQTIMPGIGAIIISGFVLWFILQKRIAKRQSLFEAQFVDALDIAARSLRAGHPLVGAFRLIAEEIAPPVGSLFAQICQAQELGLSIEKAIHEVAKTFNNPDVRIFGTSIAIQLRSGGNLADMMDRLAYVMRDRMRLNRRVRVLTAQTQFSKRVLAVLPVFIFVTLNTLNPGYMQPLYHTDMGKSMLTIAVICVVLGIWVMNRLSVIRY